MAESEGYAPAAVGERADELERLRAEDRALRRSEERFRRVLADAPQPMLLHASDGEILVLNRCWEELSGYAEDDLPSVERVAATLFTADADRFLEVLASAHERSQRAAPGEHEVRTRAGETRVWRLHSSRLPALDDGRGLAVTMALDVTEARRAETELRRSNAELERFAYAASHDLQEPLRMVTSYVQLLGRRYRGKLAGDADLFIDYAVDGAKRMQRLISDLLTYARVGRGELAPERIDTEALVRSAAAELASALRESEAELAVDPLPPLLGSAFQLRLVLQNLIGNALKYRSEAPPEVHLGREEGERGLVGLFVRDNGRGFEPEYAERIFQPFERLGGAGGQAGTGLGLALVERVVTRHGGRVWAESAPGRGSTFHLRLPPAREPEERPEEAP